MPLAVVMAVVIKLFHTLQSFYKSLGLQIRLSQSCRSQYLLSAINLFLSISTVQLFLSTSAFFLFEAQTADEYGISFYISITVLSVIVDIGSVAWNINKILTLIGNYEKFLKKR